MPRDPATNDLLRTSADLLLLSVIAEESLYGYAIAKRITTRSDGAIRITPGTLYPLLHQLEKQGLLLASWQTVVGDRNEQGGGRKRKWYRLSAKGRRHLSRRVTAHRASQALIETFLPGQAS